MGDDGCSASDLRRRYHMGGELKDDHLTAPQLRARYGIKKNTAGMMCTKMRFSSTIWSMYYSVYRTGCPLDAGVEYVRTKR